MPKLADAQAFQRYDRLALHVRRGHGDRPGERRLAGRPQPSGIELEAYSAYAPGDDLRHLDWNALGRLDALLVRRFTAEREVLFHFFVDCSASMGAPPADGKLARALELTMALVYLALSANDAARVVLLSGTGAPICSPVYRQRAKTLDAAAFLEAATAEGGRLDLGTALTNYAHEHRRPGAAFLVSDFMMDPEEVDRGVRALRHRRYAVHLLHVVGAHERDPMRLFTRGLLRDVESGATRPIELTPRLASMYRRALATHEGAVRSVAERAESAYACLVTDRDVGDFVTTELSRIGLVWRR